jgi:hypothetical protein
MIALGMSVLAWVGLVGFGIPATLLGFGACFLAGRAACLQRQQADPEPGVRAIIVASYLLGGGAAVAGIVVFVALASVL